MKLFGRRLSGKSGEDRPEGAAGPVAQEPAGEYAGLDARVARLLTDFQQGRFGVNAAGKVDYAVCRDAALDLHSQVTDEESLVALLRFHDALMSSGVDGLRREGRDPSGLEALWREDYFLMLTREVVGADGAVDQDKLEHLNRREREAGRLGDGESFNIQQAPPAGRAEDGTLSARLVGERILALWTVVLRSIAPGQRETLLQAFAAEGGRHWLTDAEVAFLLDEQPEHGVTVAFGWQAERLVVLLWAVGLAELPDHDAKCDPVSFAQLVPPTSQVTFEAFLGSLRLRDRAEIDAAAADIDRSYWTAHAAVAEEKPVPDGVDLEVLAERLYAIAWLQGQQVADWP